MSQAAEFPWLRGKSVLVTGGSAGFGAVFAQAVAAAGARVAITGRDPERLKDAVAKLQASGADACGFRCDATRAADVQNLAAAVQQRFGTLDLLLNNIGRSTRGLAVDTTPEQFRESFETNFLSAVHCTQAMLPLFPAGGGHLIFMGSLAAKVVSRFLGAYPASKFALAAYVQQLRLELAPRGMHVLLVCPGPIAREDAGQRYAAEAAHLPAAARQPGGGVKLKAIPPEDLARRILLACQRRSPELVVPGSVRWLAALSHLWPSLAEWIVTRKTGPSSSANEPSDSQQTR